METTRYKMAWLALVVLVFALGLWVASLRVPETARAANHMEAPRYGPIGLWQDTTLRVNLVNVATPNAAGVPPSPCTAEVMFFDEMGNSLGMSSRLSVEARHIAFADLMFPVGRAGRVEVHPVIHFLRDDNTCKAILSSAEVFDSMGVTQVYTNPVVLKGFNPQPEPPGILEPGA